MTARTPLLLLRGATLASGPLPMPPSTRSDRSEGLIHFIFPSTLSPSRGHVFGRYAPDAFPLYWLARPQGHVLPHPNVDDRGSELATGLKLANQIVEARMRGWDPLPLGVSAALVSLSFWAGPAVSIFLSGGVGTHPPSLTFRLWINSPSRLTESFGCCCCSLVHHSANALPSRGVFAGCVPQQRLRGESPASFLSHLTHLHVPQTSACFIVESHLYSNDFSIDAFVYLQVSSRLQMTA